MIENTTENTILNIARNCKATVENRLINFNSEESYERFLLILDKKDLIKYYKPERIFRVLSFDTNCRVQTK